MLVADLSEYSFSPMVAAIVGVVGPLISVSTSFPDSVGF
jgi:hypothetical protein